MKKNINLAGLSEEEILRLKIKNLSLSIEGSWLKDCVEQLYQELEAKNLKFRPLCYLADEWLTPDKEPVIGIPFFLAHPELIKLEKKMMLDAEGCNRPWCMKLLRHEAGHAINYAYRLYRKKSWRKIFGHFSKEYEDTYRFRPYSKNYVKHLEDYYAQYHPDEDFAETFAVWLTPGFNWQVQYKGWKVIAKLNYIDKVMKELENKAPLVEAGKKYWEASRMNVSLGSFYKKKRRFYAEEFPDFHDVNLKKIFSNLGPSQKKSKELLAAADIIKKYKKEILRNVAKWTGEKKYIIGKLLDEIIKRCRKLELVTEKNESSAVLEISIYITTLAMNYIHTGVFSK